MGVGEREGGGVASSLKIVDDFIATRRGNDCSTAGL